MFESSGDQVLFRETTRRFIEAECPLTKVRELADSKEGFTLDYWGAGAELGWTSLLVPEPAGGGSIGGNGMSDLALVSYEFGCHAAPGPLGPTNVVAAALGRWGCKDQQSGPLSALMSGVAVAGWAHAEPPPGDGLDQVGLRATGEGDEVVLRGTKGPVELSVHPSHLLVSACRDDDMSIVLVPSDAVGVSVASLSALDMTRRFARVHFDAVRVPASAVLKPSGGAGPAIAWLSDLAVAIQLAEMVGAMQWAFDTTLDWSLNRFSFGRPLASYQEIKHRLADMKMWLEASYAAAAMAARAVDDDLANRSEVVSAAKFYVGRYGPELLQDCVQLHGGIGVTFDHDLHIFLRRVTTDAALCGTPAQHAARITAILQARGNAT